MAKKTIPPLTARVINQKLPVSTSGKIAKAQRPDNTAPNMKIPLLPCLSEYEENRKSRIKDLCKIAEVDYKEYLRALGTSKYGYSVVQKRDLDEIYINSYNIEWIRAWNGNMDIQVVLDYFAVITYVTDYYAKDDTGTMEIINATLEQTNIQDLKEKMRTIADVFLTHRQMGEAEAVYRLLPSMTLKKSNVACQWMSLGPKQERSSTGLT